MHQLPSPNNLLYSYFVFIVMLYIMYLLNCKNPVGVNFDNNKKKKIGKFTLIIRLTKLNRICTTKIWHMLLDYYKTEM
jgi:hypothetical protein